MGFDRSALRARWDALLSQIGIADAGLFDEVVARYGEDHRRYHTVAHVADVVRRAEELADAEGLADAPAVRLAAWFHDVIYDPRASDNEARSAAWARQELTARGAAPVLVEQVVALVLATADHSAAADDLGTSVLLDADLAVLAADRATYERYAASVREEYGFVPEASFRAGRTRVLEALLSRPLFRTPSMAASEAQARANIAREVAQLASRELAADRPDSSEPP